MLNESHAPVTLRFAQSHEGALVQALCRDAHSPIADWADWTRPLAQNWLLAETDRPVGAIMVQYGTPVGRLEFLVVPAGLSPRLHAKVVRALAYGGMAQLANHGSQLIASVISFTDPDWARIAERRGGRSIDTGHLYLKRL